MNRDARLSGVLHVLLHMAQQAGPVTSDVMAAAMKTHPVVVRRVMAGLRAQGYVRSEKGHGGGWTLACDLAQVTLRDIYAALGSPALLAIGHRTHAPGCRVEAAVHAALDASFREAEALLLARLGEVTLAMLSRDVLGHLTLDPSRCEASVREPAQAAPAAANRLDSLDFSAAEAGEGDTE